MIPILKYPRTPHIAGSRLQPGDEDLGVIAPEVLEAGSLVIEEKLDGSNSGISFDRDGSLVLQSRGHVLTGGPRERQFNLLKRWANHHVAALRDILAGFCSLGGFDTHSGESWGQWDLLRQVSDGMMALYNATVEMGVPNQVTTFTESDFGRALQPSGTGSDHGWGSHHLVLGGAVKGGDVYGTFPTLALGGPDDANNRGVLIPTTSIDQYGATMAKRFEVGTAAVPQACPNLANFPIVDVGFMECGSPRRAR